MFYFVYGCKWIWWSSGSVYVYVVNWRRFLIGVSGNVCKEFC